MMPYCDIEGCGDVADKIFATEEKFQLVALCKKHNPESSRTVRRQKVPSDPMYTKKYVKRRR